jgi:hypothetical protein
MIWINSFRGAILLYDPRTARRRRRPFVKLRRLTRPLHLSHRPVTTAFRLPRNFESSFGVRRNSLSWVRFDHSSSGPWVSIATDT